MLATGRSRRGALLKDMPDHIRRVHVRTLSEGEGSRSSSEAVGGPVALTLVLVSRIYGLPNQRPHALLWLCQLRKRYKKERLVSDAYKPSTVITVVYILIYIYVYIMV